MEFRIVQKWNKFYIDRLINLFIIKYRSRVIDYFRDCEFDVAFESLKNAEDYIKEMQKWSQIEKEVIIWYYK